MGEIGTPFEEEWIFPLGTCTFAGRTLPAPARPEKLLEATYGPNWKVPDPAFHFATPRTTYRRLNGWFRGTRVNRKIWDGRYSQLREKLPARRPSALARHVFEAGGDGRTARRRRCRTRSRLAVVRPQGRAGPRPRLLAGRSERGSPPGGGGGPRPRGRLDEPPRAALGARPGSQGRAAARPTHAPGQPPHRRHRPARAGGAGAVRPDGAGRRGQAVRRLRAPCDRGSDPCRPGHATRPGPRTPNASPDAARTPERLSCRALRCRRRTTPKVKGPNVQSCDWWRNGGSDPRGSWRAEPARA